MLQGLRTAGYNWPGITRDIKRYIASCPDCQLKRDRLKHLHGPGYHLSSGKPGEHIGMDSIVNLPPDVHGYHHILVIVDHFTRWTELTPIKTLEAEEACQVILDYITRYGTPQNITSDNGTQFINNTVGELIALLKIEPIPILPYNHQKMA